jgi:hypothetical protein
VTTEINLQGRLGVELQFNLVATAGDVTTLASTIQLTRGRAVSPEWGAHRGGAGKQHGSRFAERRQLTRSGSASVRYARRSTTNQRVRKTAEVWPCDAQGVGSRRFGGPAEAFGAACISQGTPMAAMDSMKLRPWCDMIAGTPGVAGRWSGWCPPCGPQTCGRRRSQGIAARTFEGARYARPNKRRR